MQRKVWIAAVSAAVIALVLGGVGAAGAYFYLNQRNLGYLERAEQAFAQKDWKSAKQNYAWYLTKHPRDIEHLEKYAAASLNIMEGRTEALRDVIRACFQIASPDFTNDASVNHLLDLGEKHRLWDELDYCTQVILRVHPDDRRTQYYRALALEREGRAKEAIELYTALAEQGTDKLEVYGNLALLLQKQGLPEQSVKVLDDAFAKFPDNPLLMLQKSRFLVQTRQTEQASSEIEKVLQKLPENAEAHFTAAQIAIAQKQWDAGVQHLNKAIALAPDKPEAYLGLAYTYEAMGQREKGIELLSGLPPAMQVDNPEILFSLAEMQYSANLLEQADETVKAYKRAYPEHYPVFDYFAGRELLAKGSIQEALSKFIAVSKSSPDSIRALFYQAVAYLQLKQNDLAQTALESYLRERPDDETARNLLEQVMGKPKTREKAESDLRACLDNSNTTAAALLLAAQNLLKVNTKAKDEMIEGLVVKAAEEAIKREPGLPEAYSMLMDSYLRSGDQEAVKDVLNRAAQAGVPPHKLAMMQATVSLKSNDSASAEKCLSDDLARPEITRDEMIAWARLFAAHGFLDKSLQILSDAEAKSPESDRLEVRLEQIDLCIRMGDTDKALSLINAVEPSLRGNSTAEHKLNERKLALAEALLDTELKGDTEKAQAMLEDLQRAEPESAGVKVLQGLLLLRQTPPDSDRAEAIGRGILEDNPSNVEALLLLVNAALAKGRLSSALDYATRAVSLTPQNTSGRLALADTLVRAGSFAEAQKVLRPVLTASPNQPRALEILMQAYGENGQTEEAKSVFERLEKIYGEHPEHAAKLTFLKALLCMYEKKFAEAEEYLRNPVITAADAKSAETLARIIQSQGKTEDGEKVLKQFAAQNESNVDAWTKLGQFYLSTQEPAKLSEASSAFTRALLITPDYAPALRGQIQVQMRLGNQGAAIGLCDRYLASEPGDVDILQQKAILLYRDPKQLGEALAAIEQAIQRLEKPEFFATRGQIKLAMGKYQEALDDLRRFADAQASAPAEIDSAIAEAYAGLDENDLARKYCDSALRKAQKDNRAILPRLEELSKRIDAKGEKH